MRPRQTILVRHRRNLRTGIVAAVADDRPAVVLVGLEDVDLITAIGSVLGDPELLGPGIEREDEIDPVAQREDLWIVALLADEGIVLRHRAVVVEAQRLAGVVVGMLRASDGIVGADAGAADGE